MCNIYFYNQLLEEESLGLVTLLILAEERASKLIA